MEKKPELVVVHKKEFFILFILFLLVAVFSFTLGLKLGKHLDASNGANGDVLAQGSCQTLPESAPLTAAPSAEHEVANTENNEKPDTAHHEQPEEDDKLTKKQKEQQAKHDLEKAEDHADTELYKEVEESSLSYGKKVPMKLPKQKKSIAKSKESLHKFTLQVGAYKNEHEANQRVADLKQKNLEAFYFAAKVPGKGTWFRVGVGMFDSQDAAEKAAMQWKSAQLLPQYIVQKVAE
ncbi:MAG: SPOR domain-containing protein [Bacteriovoracia bacterium]